MTTWLRIVIILSAGSFTPQLSAAEPNPADLEFFEKQVRPLLVEHCHKCHGPSAQKGGLRLDSREGALTGGDSGPAIQPGEPEQSLLITAINYSPDAEQMPPSGKLAAEQITTLTAWVRHGAPWSKTDAAQSSIEIKIDVAERAKHWSFQPITPPSIPKVAGHHALLNPVDSFLLAKLQSQQLDFAPLAAPAIQCRRLSFELTGLPPTPEELKNFLTDQAPDAYERLVDRLLASPHYGERWARHWLDLVRFAETYGHEFDYAIRYAQPYRDYVIRAWNADVPYDQFVTEHIAGDLLPEQRRDPATGLSESVTGTAFWWFGQGKHSPVDIRAEECDTVDNQLDVFGKTFLGLTIACARCHDHKFDPMTQHDYYALAGFLQSSRQDYADLNPPERTNKIVSDLKQLDREHQSQLVLATLDRLRIFVDHFAERLLATGDFDPSTLADWQKRIREESAPDPRHPLHLWTRWSSDSTPWEQKQTTLREQLQSVSIQRSRAPTADTLGGFENRGEQGKPVPSPSDMEQQSLRAASHMVSPILSLDSPHQFTRWQNEGIAFEMSPRSTLTWLFQSSAKHPVRGVVTAQTWVHSGMVSPQFQGTLRSPTFTIDKPYLDLLASRRGGSAKPIHKNHKSGQIHLIVDGFQLIQDPLYGFLTVNVAQRETPTWYRRDVSRFLGSKAYLEIEDADDGEIVIEEIAFRADGLPPVPINPILGQPLATAKLGSLDDVAHVYQSTLQAFLKTLRDEVATGNQPVSKDQTAVTADLINWLIREESLANHAPQPMAVEFAAKRQTLEAALPTPVRTLAMTSGSDENEHLLLRGNHKKVGDEIPRRFLEVFQGEYHPGINRKDLADQVVSRTNPLPARVIVNRLWQHLFGRGIVATPDDFGKMGQPPSHPELLDWLATELHHSNWSLKQTQRLLVTSHAFRMSSHLADAVTEEKDPSNVWLHRAHIQRLEAEALRDSLLLMSDRLDDRMFGPSVLPFLTDFMEGRGRPATSGPLDGDGRRSLYINVRRNFLSPLFLAFDFPTPFTTMGRRSTSNVPAQALTLMNNPFVVQQAERWVTQPDAASSTEDRIRHLYLSAYSRTATEEEISAALEFLNTQAVEYGPEQTNRAWIDLAHVLLNVKEFVFVK